MQAIRFLARSAGLGFLIASPVPAAEPLPYQVQRIVQQGDTVGAVRIETGAYFQIGTLTDSGQLVFITENTAGGEALIHYSEGKFTPIVAAGREAPTGVWPTRIEIAFPPSMNQRGSVVFTGYPPGLPPGITTYTTYRWESHSQAVTTVAKSGLPAVGDLTFSTGGWLWPPVINNHDEIAVQAMAYPGTRTTSRSLGVFFLGRDGKWQAVLVRDQALPGGGRAEVANTPSLNDAGLIATQVVRRGDVRGGRVFSSAYLWEQGTLTPVAVVGAELPGGEKVETVYQTWVNNRDRTVLVAVGLPRNRVALYRFAAGQLTPVLVPGQELPGGGRVKSIVFRSYLGWPYASYPNEVGQQAIVVDLEDGATGLYLLEPEGKLSLILKTGMTSNLGTVTHLGTGAGGSLGVGLNRRGQIAVPVKIDNGPAMIALLTPSGQ